VWFVRFIFSYRSRSLKFVNHVFLSSCDIFFISSSFHFHIKIKKIKKMRSFCSLWHFVFFFSYFLNNEKNSSSSIFHTFFSIFCPCILCSQNHSKTVPKQSPSSPAILHASSPPHCPAPPVAPLCRRRCRFVLVDLTWVWSKVVVA